MMRVLKSDNGILYGEVVTTGDITQLVELAKKDHYKGYAAIASGNRYFDAMGKQVSGPVYFEDQKIEEKVVLIKEDPEAKIIVKEDPEVKVEKVRINPLEKLTRLVNENKDLKAEVDAAKQEISALEEDISNKDQKLANKDAELKALKIKLEDITKKYNQLNEMIEAL